MNILGIESSCDESAAALVRDGCEVLTSIVYSQIPLHVPYGGVVPEIASRAHIEKIGGVIKAAMKDGEKIDAVAVTYGPGLSSSLLVGISAAKGLALALKVPLIAVNHIEAHLHTPFLRDSAGIVQSHNLNAVEKSEGAEKIEPADVMPALGLAVSGGHTTWIDMARYGEYRIIGQTLDDAAGEAFDKAAKLLDLGYPGGPKIDRLAKAYWNGADLSKYASMGDVMADAELKALKYPASIKLPKDAPRFPKGMPREGTAALAGLDAKLCVSFSGLKTALLYHVKKFPPANLFEKAMLVASYQEAIVGALVDRTRVALRKGAYKAIIVGGGVSLNGRLRASLADLARHEGVRLLMAAPKYCGDNAAMIAGLAYYRHPITGDDALAIDATPTLQAGD